MNESLCDVCELPQGECLCDVIRENEHLLLPDWRVLGTTNAPDAALVVVWG